MSRQPLVKTERLVLRAFEPADAGAVQRLAFVERHKDTPFFLYLAFTIPHANNEAGGKGMEVPSFAPYGDEEWPDAQKGHAAMITRMDRDVGRLLQKLKALGLDENTLVLFSSDNGPHREGGADPDFFDSNGPLRGIKRDLYEGGVRVPLLARWPGKIAPGGVSGRVSSFWDFMPTAADVAGIPAPSGKDGLSLLPALLGREKDQKEHPYLYWEFHERGSKQAVRMDRWKAVYFVRQDRLELYDLEEDLGERHDVAAEHPLVVEKIRSVLKTARTENPNWPLK